MPEGTLQVHLGYKLSGEKRTRTLSKPGKEIVYRWRGGHFWFTRDDTEDLRLELANHFRAQRGMPSLGEKEQRKSYKLFGHLRYNFDKFEPYIHQFTEKMISLGVPASELLHMWDTSETVKYYMFQCRNRVEAMQNASRQEVPQKQASPAKSRPVRHSPVEIPISHYWTHRPKLAGCAFCEQGKAQLTPIIRTTDDGSDAVEGGPVRVDADYIGKQLPLSSDGCRHAMAWQSNKGHFQLLPMKNKNEESLLATGAVATKRQGCTDAQLDFHADQELGPLGKKIESNGGSYNSGIANRSNSHARAEDAVKNGLGSMRACALASACPAKDWSSLAQVISGNVSRESGNNFLGLYVGPLLIFGETSVVKLEPSVYSPPAHRPSGTKVMFLHYNLNSSYGVVVEYWDENLGKRRRTEVSSTAFVAGLPAARPQFGYKRLDDEREPLATFLLGQLSEDEKPIEVPVLPKPKAYQRPKAKAKAAASRVVNQSVRALAENPDPEDQNVANWYEGFDELCAYEKWLANYDFSKHELVMDLGQTDMQDFDENRTPFEVSLGETASVRRVARPGRDFIKMTKALKLREIHAEPYSKLDWDGARSRERVKMFSKFQALSDHPLEYREIPEGSQCFRMFPVHTIKNYDTPAEWEAGYRLVGGGNQVYELRGGRWIKIGTVLDPKRDAIESATLETTRLFIHCQKVRRRDVKKRDADGAYLQSKLDKVRRPNQLYAEIPREMIPEGSPALSMKRPCFPVEASVYGIDDAGYSWDSHSRTNLESEGFHPYYDLSQSWYDHFPDGTDLSVLKPSGGEVSPELYPVDDGQLSQYVDDFLAGEDEDSGVFQKMLGALLFKSRDDDQDIGRYVGSDWVGVNDPPDKDGVYRYYSSQASYVETMVSNSEQTMLKLGGKPLREAETPSLANDSATCPEIDEAPGVFGDVAASIVCALLYVARCTRFEILFAVCRMTRYTTKWTKRQDMWLYRCLGYLKKYPNFVLHFIICPSEFEEGGDVVFRNWADTDLAGDKDTRRSTSGGCGMFVGSKTRAAVHAYCKRQGHVGASTPDTETVGLIVLGKRSIPLHMISQRSLKRRVRNQFLGDNDPAARVVGTGVSSQLAYMKRTAAISLAWAKQNMAEELDRVPTNENLADLFTKPLEAAKFHEFRLQLGIGNAQ